MRDITSNLLANKFVKLVEENHQEIVEQYMNDLLRNDKTIAYRSLDKQKIYEIGDNVYRELSQWLSRGSQKNEIGGFYEKLGKLRFQQGVPVSQVFHALVLLKRHMWLFVKKRLENDITDYKQLIELLNKVILFFDRAIFHMLSGYEKENTKRW
ncbi:MAG TPA: histidine kinase N-terminal domain-containing protein [Spirochaetota bacterium]|nr:histidine kinase N-terminal domain-containing protein [Spirochaetota bacterium]HPR49803.1 histidine kinase N-terminal domain-containing protein [Spirochaetota bacterium]